MPTATSQTTTSKPSRKNVKRSSSRSFPNLPDGLTVRQKLLYIDRPVTAPILAALLGVSPVTLYKKAQANQIPSIRIGSAVRFDPRAIARWLDGEVMAPRPKQSHDQASDQSARAVTHSALVEVES